MEKKKNILIAGLIIIIIILSGVIGYLLSNKNADVEAGGKQEETQNNAQVTVKKKASSYVGDLYLDSNGKVYFKLSNELRKNANYKSIVNSETMINDTSAVVLNEVNVQDIDYLQNGQAGFGYFTILGSNYLYIISDEKIESEYNLEVIKPNVFADKKIVSVGVDNGTDGAMAYAISEKGDKIYLYDVIENKNADIYGTYYSNSKILSGEYFMIDNDRTLVIVTSTCSEGMFPPKTVSYKVTRENDKISLAIDINEDGTYLDTYTGSKNNGVYRFKPDTYGCTTDENTYFVKK